MIKAGGRLADAKPQTGRRRLVIFAIPDKFQVRHLIHRIKVLMRRGKNSQRTGRAFRNQRAPGHGQRDGWHLGIQLDALHSVVVILPHHPLPAGRMTRKAGVVKNGTSVFLRCDDRLQVNQRAVAIKVEPQFAVKRTRMNLAEVNGYPRRSTGNTNAVQIQNRRIGLMRARVRIIKERHPAGGIFQVALTDRQPRHRIELLPDDAGRLPCSGHRNFFNERFRGIQIEHHPAGLGS